MPSMEVPYNAENAQVLRHINVSHTTFSRSFKQIITNQNCSLPIFHKQIRCFRGIMFLHRGRRETRQHQAKTHTEVKHIRERFQISFPDFLPNGSSKFKHEEDPVRFSVPCQISREVLRGISQTKPSSPSF